MKFIISKSKLPYQMKYPKHIGQYLNDRINYPIIYNRFKKQAYCCSCGKDFDYTETYYADTLITCPKCGRELLASPHTRNIFIDRCLIFANYTASEIKIAVTEVFYIYKNENWEYVKNIKAEINIIQEMLFSRGKQESWNRQYYSDKFRLDKGKGIRTYIPHEYTKYGAISHPSVEEALKNSFLRYCNLSEEIVYNISNLMKLIYVFSKYPQAEYIKKLGFGQLIHDRINNIPNHINPNWNGTTIEKILGVTKSDLANLAQWGMADTWNLGVYKFLKKYNQKIKKDDITTFLSVFTDLSHYKYYFGTFDINPLKIARYVKRISRIKNNEYQMQGYTDYRDHLEMLVELGYPLDDYYLYPKNFNAAHETLSLERAEAIAKVKNEKSRAKNKKYKKAIEDIQCLSYRSDKYLIRPIESTKEIIFEGQMMHHCVATYVDRVIAGRSYIFCVRKCAEPRMPFVTLELSADKQHIVQTRGKGNAIPPKDVIEFCEEWLNNIVKVHAAKDKKKDKKKERETA